MELEKQLEQVIMDITKLRSKRYFKIGEIVTVEEWLKITNYKRREIDEYGRIDITDTTKSNESNDGAFST